MKISKRSQNIIMALLSLLIVAYFVGSWFYTSSVSSKRMCEGVLVTVHDTSEIHFVTPQELAAELGDLPKNARYTKLRDIDVDSLERTLNHFDKIERVNINVLSSGKLLIDVWPLRPVARIFDSAGQSYYINRAGKRIAANHNYFLDVPVITGDFSASFPATSLISLLDYIDSNPEWRDAVSMIEARSPNDIILVPVIKGHVINLGDTLNLPDKLNRVKLLYSKVMAYKGWDYYSEISVKWSGQVVGVKKNAKTPEPEYVKAENNEEETEITSALIDNESNIAMTAVKPVPGAMVKAKADSTIKPTTKIGEKTETPKNKNKKTP